LFSRIAHRHGRKVQLDLLPSIQKRIVITGASLRRHPIQEKGNLVKAIEHCVWPWVKSGDIRPQIGLVLPFEKVAEAHLALEESRVTGKVILTMV